MENLQELLNSTLDGVVITETTYLGKRFRSKETMTDDDLKAENEMLHADFTLKVRFIYDGVKVEELAKQLASTTSYMKLLQNNVLKDMPEDECRTLCSTPYDCKIRQLLDTRQSRAMSPEDKLKKQIRAGKEAGLTHDEILALIMGTEA